MSNNSSIPNLENNLKSGVPLISDYEILEKSSFFKFMENYSDQFLKRNSNFLKDYSLKWVLDPLHNWSRIWEYSYVVNKLISTYNDSTFLKKEKISILDAGSGCTFFPYFISSYFNADVYCCDLDRSLNETFNSINIAEKSKINFIETHLNKTSFQNDQFDIIYCLSVLEHADDKSSIVKELHRILKPNGTLILTFDISLDGSGEIPIQEFHSLISEITQYYNIDVFNFNDNEPILTTTYSYKKNPSSLPWKNPNILERLKYFIKYKKGIKYPPLYTVFCCQATKL